MTIDTHFYAVLDADGAQVGVVRITRTETEFVAETFDRQLGEWVEDPGGYRFELTGDPGGEPISEARALELVREMGGRP